MGDAGALLLGLLMAASTMSVVGQTNNDFSGRTYFFFAPLIIPFFILGIPMLDTAFAIVRRAGRRTNPAVADKNHLHHRLMRLGHGQTRSVLILWTWTGTPLRPGALSHAGEPGQYRYVPFGAGGSWGSPSTPCSGFEAGLEARRRGRRIRRRGGWERAGATAHLDRESSRRDASEDGGPESIRRRTYSRHEAQEPLPSPLVTHGYAPPLGVHACLLELSLGRSQTLPQVLDIKLPDKASLLDQQQGMVVVDLDVTLGLRESKHLGLARIETQLGWFERRQQWRVSREDADLAERGARRDHLHLTVEDLALGRENFNGKLGVGHFRPRLERARSVDYTTSSHKSHWRRG